jgi:hypothetical protein
MQHVLDPAMPFITLLLLIIGGSFQASSTDYTEWINMTDVAHDKQLQQLVLHSIEHLQQQQEEQQQQQYSDAQHQEPQQQQQQRQQQLLEPDNQVLPWQDEYKMQCRGHLQGRQANCDGLQQQTSQQPQVYQPLERWQEQLKDAEMQAAQ